MKIVSAFIAVVLIVLTLGFVQCADPGLPALNAWSSMNITNSNRADHFAVNNIGLHEVESRPEKNMFNWEKAWFKRNNSSKQRVKRQKKMVELNPTYNASNIYLAKNLTRNYGHIPDLSTINYIINNSNACNANNPIFAVMCYISFTGNYEARQTIRKSYPVTELQRLGLRRIFVVGVIRNHHVMYPRNRTQEEIEEEHLNYSDLVQIDMTEDYRNLTYKSLKMLQWVVEYCFNARYIIKLDDDITIDLYQIVKVMKGATPEEEKMIWGKKSSIKPLVQRNPKNKYYVPFSDYPDPFLPQVVLGLLFIMQPNTSRELLNYVKITPYMSLEDMYITGLLRRNTNIELKDISYLRSYRQGNLGCCVVQGVRYQCWYAFGERAGYPRGENDTMQQMIKNHAELCYLEECPDSRKVLKGPGCKI